MRRLWRAVVFAAVVAGFGSMTLAQHEHGAGPYRVLKTVKVGGEGGFDYVQADAAGRRLYIARSGAGARITVFDLDTLEPAGEIAVPSATAHGVVIDPKVHHGFVTSKPVEMFDSKTLSSIKNIDVQGNPDGIFFDVFNERVYDLSHSAPNVTVINAADGSVAGTIDLGGAPEQTVSDGAGHLYIDIEDKGSIAVVDAKTLAVTAKYDLAGKGGTCAGLAIDVQHRILFATCRNPQTMVILSADDGKIITTLPIGMGTDGAVFNPATMEAFSSHADGTLTVVKENSPTSFEVEQTVSTMPTAKTLTLDAKTNHILLIAAEFAPAPADAPTGQAGRPARGPMVAGSFSILVVGR
jgi:hypothetical protein